MRSHFDDSECSGVTVRLLVTICIIFGIKISLRFLPFGKENFPWSSVGQKIVLIEHQVCTCVQK